MTNYLQHFGLNQRVFKRDKKPYLLISDQLRQAEREFASAFDDNYCVLTVSGPIGSGKTTAVSYALSKLSMNTQVIRLGRVRLEPDEVVELLLAELGISEPPAGTIRKLAALGQKVRELKDAGSRLVVVVEDAARTGVDTLSELEVICSSDGGFDIGLVLCGDESLPRLISDDRLKRLAQRVSANLLISRLAVDEMEEYLLTALKEAGGDPAGILGNDVPALLHILSCGIPRLANKLMEAALKNAAAESEARVTCALLADVAESQFGITTEIPIKRRSKATAPKQPVTPATHDEPAAADAPEFHQDQATAAASLAVPTRLESKAASQDAAGPDESSPSAQAPVSTNVEPAIEQPPVVDAVAESARAPDAKTSTPDAESVDIETSEPVEAAAPPVLEPELPPADPAPPVLEPMVSLESEAPASITEPLLTGKTAQETGAHDGSSPDPIPAVAQTAPNDAADTDHRDETPDSAPKVEVPVLESTSPQGVENVTESAPAPSAVAAADAAPDSAASTDDEKELPYLIQDTQPSLAALSPKTLPDEAAAATDHEMLPDLDELAAELAATDPIDVPAVSIPELPVEPAAEELVPSKPESPVVSETRESAPSLPELTVEDAAKASAPSLPEVPVEDAAKASARSLPELPVDTAVNEAKPEPVEAEAVQDDFGAPSIDSTSTALPKLIIDPMPETPNTPETAVEAELAQDDASAPSIDATSTALPKLVIDPMPETPRTSEAPPEVEATTADEAELISAMAEEHAATEAGNEQDIGFDETTVKVVDTSTSTLDAQAADAKKTPMHEQREEPADTFAVTSSLDESAADELSATTTEAEPVVAEVPAAEANIDDLATEALQDPSLQLEVLDDIADVSVEEMPDDAVVVHDADRDPTLAQLKPDLDALELALAENFVPEGEEAVAEEDEANGPVPEITLDDSIEEKVAAESEELAKREAEIAARKKAEEDKHAPKPKSGPSDTEVHKLAAELQRANTLEDMDDKLAETLFGDEINQVASQVLKAAREQAENSAEAAPEQSPPSPPAADGSADPDIKKQFEEVWGQVPDETEAIDLKSAKPNSGLDMSASQRLATVRALNAGMGTPPPPAPANKKPVKPKEKPVPIEDQIDISMTNTMKALNIDPEMLEPPKDEEESPKGGFFSRFRKKG
ncbi:MAG: hypothetical protein QNJ05_11685 [Woeseiaceae bacterium]|nr:hypothetical protein [Woeseiaceae bacterium]